MEISVQDVDTKVITTYDYSKDNWANIYACMSGGLVHMWAPIQCGEGIIIKTSGRRWAVHKEGSNPGL